MPQTVQLIYLEEPRPSVEVIEKCKSKLTHLSLVWKTAGGVAKPFFNETKAKPCGGRRTSGLGQPTGQTGRTWGGTTGDSRADSGPSGGGVRQHLGHLHKVLNNIEAEDVIGWAGVQPRREGAWRKPKPPGWRKKKTSFLFCTGSIVW